MQQDAEQDQARHRIKEPTEPVPAFHVLGDDTIAAISSSKAGGLEEPWEDSAAAAGDLLCLSWHHAVSPGFALSRP